MQKICALSDVGCWSCLFYRFTGLGVAAFSSGKVLFVCLAVFMRAFGGFLGLRLEGWAIGVSRQGSIGDLGLFGFRVSGIFGFRVLSIRVLGS